MLLPIKKSGLTPYFFILPGVLILVSIIFFPLAYVAYLSFHGAAFLRPNMPFIGFQNYQGLLSRGAFWNAATVTTIFVSGTVVFAFLLGLVAAVALNRRVRGIWFFRLLIVLPYAVPVLASGIAWRLLLLTPFGMVDYMLRSLGLLSTGSSLLTAPPPLALLTVTMVNVWRYYPFVMLTLIAGLQAIPKELYEAAEMDGANSWRQFRHVALPLLMPIALIVLVILAIWNINAFTAVFVLTGGGPVRDTEAFALYIYRESFTNFEFGVGAANSMILLVVGLILVVLYTRAIKKGQSWT